MHSDRANRIEAYQNAARAGRAGRKRKYFGHFLLRRSTSGAIFIQPDLSFMSGPNEAVLQVNLEEDYDETWTT